LEIAIGDWRFEIKIEFETGDWRLEIEDGRLGLVIGG